MSGQEILMELTSVAKVCEEYTFSMMQYRNMCIESKQSFPEEYEKLRDALTKEIERMGLITEEIKLSDDILFDGNLSKNELINNLQITCDIMIETRRGLEEIHELINKLYKPVEVLS